MNTTVFHVTPIDTLMFRDGRPFNQADEGVKIAQSQFPPPPPSLAGAIRLGLAQQNGYKSNNKWPAEKLGDGTNWRDESILKGKLVFGACCVARCRDEGKVEPLFPAPLHLAGPDSHAPCPESFLSPPENLAFASDLGAVRFPALPRRVQGHAPLEDCWLSEAGMDEVLKGKLPLQETVFRLAGSTHRKTENPSILEYEPHTGIGVDIDQRNAREGELYIARFLRLRDGFGFLQSVTHRLPAPDGFTQRLGGEHRMARFEPVNTTAPEVRFASFALNPGDRYLAVSLSPIRLCENLVPDGEVAGLPGRLRSVCMAKPFRLGGWNSSLRRPLPMGQVIPPGAVFFMEYLETEPWQPKPLRIGASTDWGFGKAVMGKWPIVEEKGT